MKERPILFSSSMVRAILDGRKTQTRRIVKPQPTAILTNGTPWSSGAGDIKCPYGQPGTRLWVRETFMEVESSCCDGSCGHKEYAYRATEKSVCFVNDGDGAPAFNKDGTTKSPWKPSIFCTRAASRINLEITGIRIERLNDIGDADALAEGIEEFRGELGHSRHSAEFGEKRFWKTQRPHPANWTEFASTAYMSLWESINGLGSWALNPWVWVVEFKLVEA